jgi:hypothetical protein
LHCLVHSNLLFVSKTTSIIRKRLQSQSKPSGNPKVNTKKIGVFSPIAGFAFLSNRGRFRGNGGADRVFSYIFRLGRPEGLFRWRC